MPAQTLIHMTSVDIMRACNVTAAHFITLDFTALTDEKELWSKGFLLEDRVRRQSIKVFSLIELEQGIVYSTPRGNSVVRISRTEACLADKITLPVDLCDAAISPRTSFVSSNEDESSVAIGSALQHVRALGASPSAETLGALQHTLGRLPASDDGWLESFLALDGLQALLDVLSHSQQQQQPPPPTPPLVPPPPTTVASPSGSAASLHQSPYSGAQGSRDRRLSTSSDEDNQVQARCIGCLALLLRRRAALEALLTQPHAVTCLVAALEVRGLDAQCRVADVLLRIALAPRGVSQMLSAESGTRPQTRRSTQINAALEHAVPFTASHCHPTALRDCHAAARCPANARPPPSLFDTVGRSA